MTTRCRSDTDHHDGEEPLVSLLTADLHDRSRGRRSYHAELAIDLAPELGTVTEWLYRELNERGVDLAAVSDVAHALNVSESVVRAAAAGAVNLGLCAGENRVSLYCLPPQPLRAGFRAVPQQGRLMLRLPRRGRRAELVLSGQRIGPVPHADRDETVGSGELAHVVSRLTLMASSWLPPVPGSPTQVLFELIAAGWSAVAPPRGERRELGVHQVGFDRPIARTPHGYTSRLALVTHYRRGCHQLVNVYPITREG
jgi:hypothetical protein